MNIPTKITFSRIVLVILLITGLIVLDYIPQEYPNIMLGNSQINIIYFVSFFIFFIASSTDFLDGYLARKWHQVTNLGKFLDPIADKLLVDSMLIFLLLPHYGSSNLTFPIFAVVIMIARDLVVDALRSIAASKGVVLAANIFGKIKTVLQMLSISLVLLNGWPFSYFDSAWNPALRITSFIIYLTTLISLLSGVIYVVQNFKVLKEDKHD